MTENPFEPGKAKRKPARKGIRRPTKSKHQPEDSTKLLIDNVRSGIFILSSLVIGGLIIQLQHPTKTVEESVQESISTHQPMTAEEFYSEYDIEGTSAAWEWNPDDFVIEGESTENIEFILYDQFTGEDTTIDSPIQAEEAELDLSGVTPGIYTVINAGDTGYLEIGFNQHDYLTVYNNQPIYNVPVTSDTVITINNLDLDTESNLQLTMTSQDDYINHDQNHKQGIFITGKSMFDNTVYEDEHQLAYYPELTTNDLEHETFVDETVYNVPGSVFFSNT